MPLLPERPDSGRLRDLLRNADVVTADLISETVDKTCPRLASNRQTANTIRIGQLIESEAWTDAALALIELELPQWRVRRIAYDEGEWHCALSRQRELPEWLDQAVETHHTDLPLAILAAFIDAQGVGATPARTSVPTVPRDANPLFAPMCCDNFA